MWPAAGLLACAAGFTAISVMVATRTGIVALDRRIYTDLHGTYGNFYFFGLHFTDVFTPYFDAAVLMVTGAVVAWRRRAWTPLLAALWALAICLVAVLDIKYAIGRPSPGGVPNSAGGFPSGHTASAMTMLGAAAMLAAPRGRPRRTALAATSLIACLVAVCMVYDRFHFLADVVGSLLLSPLLLHWVTLTPPYRALAAAETTRDARVRRPSHAERPADDLLHDLGRPAVDRLDA